MGKLPSKGVWIHDQIELVTQCPKMTSVESLYSLFMPSAAVSIPCPAEIQTKETNPGYCPAESLQ